MSPNDSLAGSSIIVPVAHVCRVVPRDGDGACAVGACGCEPAGVPNGGGRRLGSERSCTAGAVIRGLVGAGAANRGDRKSTRPPVTNAPLVCSLLLGNKNITGQDTT